MPARTLTFAGLALCVLGVGAPPWALDRTAAAPDPTSAPRPASELSDAPRWGPAPGVTIERSYKIEHSSTLDRARARVGTELRDVEGVAGSIEVLSTTQITVTDRIAAIAGDRPTQIVRSFDDLAYESVTTRKGVAGGDERREVEGSDLESKTVAFTWDESDEKYARAWEGEAGDDELLADLNADAEMRDWLPTGGIGAEIEDGTEWTVPVAAFRYGVRRPCGQVHFHGEKPRPRMRQLAEAALWDALEGNLLATWRGVRDTDGRSLGVIAVTGETNTSAKLENDAPDEDPPRLEIEERQIYAGEILWDLAARRAHSFEIKAQGQQIHMQPTRVRQEEREFDVQTELTFKTETRWTATFAAK